MKVLERAKTIEGFDIQVEDWSENYPSFIIHDIAIYPIAAKTSKSKWIEGGKTFRLHLSRFNSIEEVYQTFNDLQTGNKTIADLKEHFWNGEKDCYLLGL